MLTILILVRGSVNQASRPNGRLEFNSGALQRETTQRAITSNSMVRCSDSL
jgi:hypothetical protein